MTTSARLRKVILITATALVLGPSPAQAAYGLAGEWRLDDGFGTLVADSSGSGQHGRITPGPSAPTRVGGVEGFALHFDGDDEVVMPDSSRLEPPRLTVEAWVRNPTTPGAYRYVVSKGATACEASSYGLYTASGGGLAFYVKGASGFSVSSQAAASVVWDGRWHHAAGTYDGETVRLFVDGVQVGSARPAPPAIVYGLPSTSLRLGTYRGNCNLPFTGDIDTVRIWNLALTTSEVATAPANPHGRPQPSPEVPRPGTPAPAAASVASAGCLSVSPRKRRVRVGRRTRLTTVVRRNGRPARRVRVVLSGKGIRRTVRRTDRRGRVRVVVRLRRKATVRLRAYGTRPRCRAPIVTIKAR